MKQDPRLAVNLGFGQLISNEAYFKYWRTCAAMGPLFLMAFIICWGVLGYNNPPIPADFTAEQMAAHFNEHSGNNGVGEKRVIDHAH